MKQIAIWEPPVLCGCQLRINGNWEEDQQGHTYRHPTPFSILEISIVNVCDSHKDNMSAMPDISRHFEIDPITGNSYQARGYLQHPVEKPTDAHNLYEFLCAYNGQVNTLSCGCRGYQLFDHENNFISWLEHPKHTRKCGCHRNDTIDMQHASAAIQQENLRIP